MIRALNHQVFLILLFGLSHRYIHNGMPHSQILENDANPKEQLASELVCNRVLLNVSAQLEAHE
jgi:hypothetical protein